MLHSQRVSDENWGFHTIKHRDIYIYMTLYMCISVVLAFAELQIFNQSTCGFNVNWARHMVEKTEQTWSNMVLMIMMASCNKHAGFVQHRWRYKGSNCGDVSDARNWKYTEVSRSRRWRDRASNCDPDPINCYQWWLMIVFVAWG